MTDTQIDTRTAVDLVKMRMGNELGLHLDQVGVPVNVVVWQMILPLFISKGTTVAALRLLDVIFFEGSSLAVSVYIKYKMERAYAYNGCRLTFLFLLPLSNLFYCHCLVLFNFKTPQHVFF